MNPKGIPSLSPRLRVARYLGNRADKGGNPERGCGKLGDCEEGKAATALRLEIR